MLVLEISLAVVSNAAVSDPEPVILEDTWEDSEDLYSYKDIFDLRIPESYRPQELSALDVDCGFTAGFADEKSGILLYIAEFREEEAGTQELLEMLVSEEDCELARLWRINQVDTVYFGTGDTLGIAVTGAGGKVYAVLLELEDESPEQTQEALDRLRSFRPHKEETNFS